MIRPDEWRPADGLELEPNAFNAATEQVRNLALTAGPGAGKTEMLAQRADFLLRTGLCRYPKRILAISFKVDASRNLKERVKRRCGQSLASRLDSHTFHAFAKRIIDRFRPVLTGRDALDPDYQIGERRVTLRQIMFGDLVPLATEILRNSNIARSAVRQTYSHVFLDEFQDCTNEQYRLIQLAFLGTNIRLTAVGDTKQRIMGWAGALEGIFVNYSEDFNARGLNLYSNFRSIPRLRRMQNAMIRVMDPAAALRDEDIIGMDGEIAILPFENSQQEATSLVDLIQEWIETDGLPPSEIAVLVSKQPEYYAELLMTGLELRGIPFRNEQRLQDISVEPAARLVVDFLSVVYGNREPEAYIRLMYLLVDAGFDEEDQSTLRSEWQRYLHQVRTAVLRNAEIATSIEYVWERVENFLVRLGRARVVSLSSDYEQGTRLNDVIGETRERISELLEIEPDLVTALSRFSDDRAVRIMTIHKSKGLEFESVIMLGIEAETFWGEAEAERSAYFVGISRAKSRLVLTYAAERPTPTGYTRRWSIRRRRHEEFVGYAQPFVAVEDEHD